MDEVFGDDNFISQISFNKNSGLGATLLPTANDYIIWYGKNKSLLKYRGLKQLKGSGEEDSIGRYTSALHLDGRVLPLSRLPENHESQWKTCTYSDLTKPGPGAKYSIKLAMSPLIVENSPRRHWAAIAVLGYRAVQRPAASRDSAAHIGGDTMKAV